MNICFFTNQHVSEFRGGVEKVTSILTKEFKANGYNVIMLSSLPPINGDQLLENQFILPNNTINSKENQGFLSSFIVRHKINIIINQSEVKAILKLIKDSVPNIPVISVLHTDPAAAIKAVQDNWDFWKLQYNPIKFTLLSPYLYIRKLYQRYTRKKYTKEKHQCYYKQSNAIVLLSEKFFDSFRDLTDIKDTSKLYAINNPQSITRIQDIENKKENIVLFVGRLIYQKRLDRLFRIWKRIKDKKDWKLIIVGDGPEREFYKNLSRKWNVEDIEFVGQCNPSEFYKRAKILCMTSSFEGSPCVLQEAIQHNVIPLGFNSFESIEDTISNNIDGFTIKPFSISDYSNTLKLLMNNATYRESIIDNIKQKNTNNVRHIDKIMGQWESLFKKLTKKE